MLPLGRSGSCQRLPYHPDMAESSIEAGATPFAGIWPDNPTGALLRDLAEQARARAVGLVFSALEHLLEQQSWARDQLARHAGSTVLVTLDVAPLAGLSAPAFRATIDRDGLLRHADPEASPQATLAIRPSAEALFSFLRDGTQGLQRHLRIEGDVALAATLAELARHLRWDAEEDLSQVVGDIAAHRIAGLLTGLAGRMRELGDRAQASATRFAAGGTQVVVTPQLRSLTVEAAALEQRIRALERRAGRLTG
ncbi:MAG: hypothetical protein RIS35_3036 [Pseudomonadota bacterium]